MGLLDDAIRQHLELKRQHGAPEEELRRQEEEALGPARRDVAPAGGEDGERGAEHEAGEPVAAEDEGALADAYEQETALQDPETAEPNLDELPDTAFPVPEPAVPEPEEPEPDFAPYDADPDASSYDEEAVGESPLEPKADHPPADPAFDTTPRVIDDPEQDDDDLLDEESEPRDEGDADVLEDTPDFLQETPEHDRLWFEQKPPRDFDFD
jgi:hypothetical protein